MRARSIAVLVATGIAFSHAAHVTALSRCSYTAAYPNAIDRQTFMLASATPVAVMATTDTVLSYARPVRAQVMRIQDVAGSDADTIRRALRANGDSAVFVRYHINASCGPLPMIDGSFDSVGVGGLYIGRPRASERWIAGKPTFDVFRAEHYPLPQRLTGPSSHLVIIFGADTTPPMTAEELFTMYGALWSESVSVDDTMPSVRIRRWAAANPRAARKQPTDEITLGVLSAVVDAKIAASPVPYGGTFAITISAPGVDTVVIYGQTSTRMRPWIADVVRDTASKVPIATQARSFAVDFAAAATREGFAPPYTRIGCAGIAVIVDRIPIVPGSDSTWTGRVSPSGFLQCAPPTSLFFAETRPRTASRFALGETEVRFRLHADGRVTFEATTAAAGKTPVVVRGERVGLETEGRRF